MIKISLALLSLFGASHATHHVRRLEDDAPTAYLMPPPPFAYTMENGYDFVANDIGNAQMYPAESCAGACFTMANCKAFSWTNLNGGTCWFKSGRGTVVYNPDVRSALVFSRPGPGTCALRTDIDFVGNDIGSQPAENAGACCLRCQAFPGCRAFSFSNFNGGTCWFKSAKGRAIVKAGVTSAEAYPNPLEPSGALEPGIDFVGNDIGSATSSSAQGCVSVCMNWGGCRAFSWTNQNGGTCWLKNLKGDTKSNANVISAQLFQNPPPPSCSLEIDVDYVGNDIGNAPSSDAYNCCSICTKTYGCKAFSWSNHNGGTCWLKSGKGSTATKSGVKSSVI